MKRCEHSMLKGLCVVKSCSHWDGVDYNESPKNCVQCGKLKRQSRGSLCGRCGRRGKVAA